MIFRNDIALRASAPKGRRNAAPGMADCYDCTSPEGAAENDMCNPFRKRKFQPKEVYMVYRNHGFDCHQMKGILI